MAVRPSLAARAAAPYRGTLAALDPRVRLVAASSFLFVAARMSLMTFLGIFLVRERGLDLAVVGAGFLVENVVRGAMAPLGGALSDRVGRRRVMLASALAAAVVMPCFLLVRGVPSLLAWSAEAGLAQGAYFPAATALLLDLAPAARRQNALAFHYTALSLGYTLGVAPAGFLAQQGYGWLAVESSGAFVAVALVAALALRGLPAGAGARAGSLARDALRAPRDGGFLALAALAAVFPLGIGLTGLAVPVYARDGGLSEGAIGLLLGSTGVLLALVSLPFNARGEAAGPFRWLPLAGALVAAAYLALAAGPAPATVALGLATFTLGEAIFSAAVPAGVALLAPPGMRGAYQGAWNMVMSLGVGAALVLGGLGRDALGWRATWLLLAAHAGLAAVLLALARPWFRRTAGARAAGAAPRGAVSPAATLALYRSSWFSHRSRVPSPVEGPA